MASKWVCHQRTTFNVCGLKRTCRTVVRKMPVDIDAIILGPTGFQGRVQF
jgi:hypothetical protein